MQRVFSRRNHRRSFQQQQQQQQRTREKSWKRNSLKNASSWPLSVVEEKASGSGDTMGSSIISEKRRKRRKRKTKMKMKKSSSVTNTEVNGTRANWKRG